MGWFRNLFRSGPSETEAAIEVLYSVIKEHLDSGGDIEDFMSVTVIEPVQWLQKKQTWAVKTSADLVEGKRVTLLSGRGGRLEDAVAVADLGEGLWTISYEHPLLESGEWYRSIVGNGLSNGNGKEV